MEWLASEYGLTFRAAVWETPLALAMVMLPVRNERRYRAGGPGHVARASIAARNRAKAWLEANFRIVPQSPAETGWLLG